MLRALLIANRGEIACRIIRSAKTLGIRTVAVYSDADAHARHVKLADDAYCIGPASPLQSYLSIDRVLDAAAKSGADAIHPGYGFLAENPAFAQACEAAGVVFVGPPLPAIRAMGSKSAARALMEEAGVPILPGYHGDDQSDDTLKTKAEAIGYPLLIKPSAGGGGKGMRVVENAAAFTAALDGARREAAGAFGDERMILERYLDKPRHVEIQVFADQHGNALHLFERDCSVQRRHQKILEEAPAPGLLPETRENMGQAALEAARTVNYVGAGTVEFLLEASGDFYFMEMNTRLQVEHPVTELVTGQDLVEWQLRIAAGESLPCSQDDLSLSGHAIEARVYAEDPARNFLPATGTLVHLRFPEENANVRVDAGVLQGDTVSIHYDPLIAKLIVWDRDRTSAVKRLRQALRQCEIAGVTTNLEFLARVAAHEAYGRAEMDTAFVDRHLDELLPNDEQPDDESLALACLFLLQRHAQKAQATARRSADPHSPWFSTCGWRLNGDGRDSFRFPDIDCEVGVRYLADGYRLHLPGGEVSAIANIEAGTVEATLDGRRVHGSVVVTGTEVTVIRDGLSRRIRFEDPDVRAAQTQAGAGHLTAPMPGRLVSVMVSAGDEVKSGTPLMILEAMKMEHTITAPTDGTVSTLHFAEGDLVEEGTELLTLETVNES